MKQTIRLNESDLRNLIKEALDELNWKTYANAAKKQRDDNRAEQLADFAAKRFNDEFGYEELDGTYDEGGLPYRQDVRGFVSPNGEGYMGMGHWTPMNAQTHAGYYPEDENDALLFNPNSTMKPTQNIINKFQKAYDEIHDFNNGNFKYIKGKGWVKDNEELDESITRAIRKLLR